MKATTKTGLAIALPTVGLYFLASPMAALLYAGVTVALTVLVAAFSAVFVRVRRRGIYYETRQRMSDRPSSYPSKLRYVLLPWLTSFPDEGDPSRTAVLREIADDREFEGSLRAAVAVSGYALPAPHRKLLPDSTTGSEMDEGRASNATEDDGSTGAGDH